MRASPRQISIRIRVDRKAAIALIVLVMLIGGAGLLSSQKLTMTATYPIPAGVYNQIVTTGNSGSAPANTTLNRNAGDTILVPPTNGGGLVGVGTAIPQPYAKLDVNTSGNRAIRAMDNARGGLLLGYQGASVQGRTTTDDNGVLYLNPSGGNVSVGGANPTSALTVAGSVQLGPDVSTCGLPNRNWGALRYSSNQVELCQGSSWGAGHWVPLGWLPYWAHATVWDLYRVCTSGGSVLYCVGYDGSNLTPPSLGPLIARRSSIFGPPDVFYAQGGCNFSPSLSPYGGFVWTCQ